MYSVLYILTNIKLILILFIIHFVVCTGEWLSNVGFLLDYANKLKGMQTNS